MPQFLKTYIVILIVASFGFVAVYESAYHIIEDEPADIGCYFDSESSKSGKEKEKEVEKSFLDHLSLNISETVIILNNYGLYRGTPEAVQDFYSEITPPPPKA